MFKPQGTPTSLWDKSQKGDAIAIDFPRKICAFWQEARLSGLQLAACELRMQYAYFRIRRFWRDPFWACTFWDDPLYVSTAWKFTCTQFGVLPYVPGALSSRGWLQIRPR